MSAAKVAVAYTDVDGTYIAVSSDSGVSFPNVNGPTPQVPALDWVPPDPDEDCFAEEGDYSQPVGSYPGIFAGIDNYGNIVVTDDDGVTWSVVSTFNDSYAGMGFFPDADCVVGTKLGFAAWGESYYSSPRAWAVVYSTDGGVTWSRYNSIDDFNTPYLVKCHPVNGTILMVTYATTVAAKVYRSTNGGASEAAVSTPGFVGVQDEPRALVGGADNEWYLAMYDFDSTSYHFYHSTDDGLTWTQKAVPTGMTVTGLTYIDASGVVVAVGVSGGEYRVAWSFDDGATWTSPTDLTPPFTASVGAPKAMYLGPDVLFLWEGETALGTPNYIRGAATPPGSFDAAESTLPNGGVQSIVAVMMVSPATAGGIGAPVQPSVPTGATFRAFEVLSGPGLSSGCIASFDGMSEGKLEFRVDNQDSGTLVVDEEAPWLASVLTDMILRITDHNGRVSEWRVEEIEESEQGDGLAYLRLKPLYNDLGRIIVREEVVGGPTLLSVTVANMTADEIYDQILAPQMPTWITKGTMAPTQKLSTTQTAWSLQQWVDWIAKETEHEVYFERTGPGAYTLHIIAQRGSTAKEITAFAAKDVLELKRTRRQGNVATHLIPIGMTVPGAISPAGLGQNAFVVVSVDVSQDAIVIEDPNGADDPVYFADEFNVTTIAGIAREPHVIRTDGTLAEILDSEVVAGVSRLYLDDASGFSVGDHVTIAKNANGTYLPGLYDPAAVAQFGVIEGVVQLTSLRGERNYIPNSEPRNWTIDGEGWAGQSNGGSSGASLPLTNMVPGTSLPAGMSVYHASPGTSPVTTTTSEVVDGAGQVTLSLSGSMTVSNGAVIYVYKPNSPPDDWSPNGVDPLMWRTSRDQTVILGDADGTQTSVLYLDVKNLSAGQWIPFGWEVNGVRIIQEATADGSGNVTLHLAGLITVADDDPLTIQGILMGTDAGDIDRVVTLSHGHTSNPHTYDSEPIAIIPQGYPVYAQAWFTSELGDWEYGAAVSGWAPPRLDLIPSSGYGGTVFDADRAGYPTPFDFRLTCAAPSPTTVKTWMVRISPPTYDLSPLYDTVLPKFYCRGIMIHTGPDPDAPFVYGSHANAIFHPVHRALGVYGQSETSWVITKRDLSALVREGYVQADNVIALGGSLRIVSLRFGVDITRRILLYVVDLVTPENSGIVLDEYQPEFTRILLEIRQQQMQGA